MNVKNPEYQRKKINRGVHGLLAMVITFSLLIILVVQFQVKESTRMGRLAHDHHLAASKKSLELLGAISEIKLQFRDYEIELYKNDVVTENELSLSPIKAGFTNRDYINSFSYEVKKLVSEIHSIQQRYADPKFKMLDSMFEKTHEKIQADLNDMQSTGSYSSKNIDSIVAPLLLVTYQQQRLHQYAFQEAQLSMEDFNKQVQNKIIVLIVALTIIGLIGIIKMLGHVHLALSDLIKTQNELYESENNYSSLAGNIKDGVLVRFKGKHVFVNQSMAAMLGYEKAEELLGSTINDVVHPDAQKKWLKDFKSLTQDNEKENQYETTFLTKMGDSVTVEINTSKMLWKGKSASIITVRNISERKLADNELRETSQLLNYIIENVPSMIFLKRASDLRFEYLNCAGEALLGLDRTEMLGRNDHDFFPREQADFFTEKDREVLQQNDALDIPEETIDTPRGQRLLHTQKIAVRDEQGNPLYLLGISEDITERAQVESIMRSMAAAGAGMQPESFMNETLERLTEIYQCQYALIGQLQPDGKHVQTLAVWANGKPAVNFQYLLEGTPCQDIFDQKKELILKDASKLYTEDKMLVDMGIESYFGAPLVGADGSVIGVLSVMGAKPFNLGKWTESILDIFAARAAVELERYLAIQELQQHREHLEEQVEARTAEMKASRDEAERANASKSDFLSHMSHELRTPMNAILGFGQMLELDAEGFNDTQRDNVKEILDAGHHLLELINDVLDLAKIESGKLEFTMEEVAVDDVLQQCIPLIASQAEVRQVALTDHVSSKGYVVQADFVRFKQVILNLLSNAVKYNCDQGRITLDSEIIDKQRLRIQITDTGEGLSKDKIAKLFKPFERLNAVNNVEGTGIGLVITKHLIEIMGGSIGVESIPGEGSTFWVELALRHDA